MLGRIQAWGGERRLHADIHVHVGLPRGRAAAAGRGWIAALEGRRVLSVLTLLDADIVETALAYKPDNVSAPQWARMRDFVLACVPRWNPPSVESFRRDLQGFVPFVACVQRQGFDLVIEEVVTREQVETWRDVSLDAANRQPSPNAAKATVQDYASRLRRIGRLINPAGGWVLRPGSVPGGGRRSHRAPYTPEEAELLPSAIALMPEGASKNLAQALHLLCRGAGLTAAEVKLCLADHVSMAAECVIQVQGERARIVPVASPWDLELQALVERHGPGPLIEVPPGVNGFNSAVRRVQLGNSMPRLSPQRLRTLWMVERLAAGAEPRALYRAAGLKSLNSLQSLVTFLPEQDERVTWAALRAEASL